jgi:DNA-directed RNA polymerase specialized sigma24 family protein
VADIVAFFSDVDSNQQMSFADVQATIMDPETFAWLMRRTSTQLKDFHTVEDLVQEAIMKLWLRLDPNHGLAEMFDSPAGVRHYLARIVQRSAYRATQHPRMASGMDALMTNSLAYESPDPTSVVETIAEIEQQVGAMPARLLRLRMYGRSLDQISHLLTRDGTDWSPGDVFIALFRLERLYPELRSLLPRVEPGEAVTYLRTWFRDAGEDGDWVDIVALRLAGYTVQEVASLRSETPSAVSSRIYRLRHSFPSLALALDSTTVVSPALIRAHALLRDLDTEAVDRLDGPWMAWMKDRAGTIFAQALRSESPDRGEWASTELANSLSLAQEIRSVVMAEPMLTLEEVADRLGIGPREVSRMVSQSELIAFGDAIGAVPAFQLLSPHLVPIVIRVNTALGAATDPYGAFFWWVSPHGRLGDLSPLDAVRDGDQRANDVLAVAQAEGW